MGYNPNKVKARQTARAYSHTQHTNNTTHTHTCTGLRDTHRGRGRGTDAGCGYVSRAKDPSFSGGGRCCAAPVCVYGCVCVCLCACVCVSVSCVCLYRVAPLCVMLQLNGSLRSSCCCCCCCWFATCVSIFHEQRCTAMAMAMVVQQIELIQENGIIKRQERAESALNKRDGNKGARARARARAENKALYK